jgi:hypothetical protein
LQAMASGLPVVAPNRGGIITYANSENAWLAPPDSQFFSAAIQNLFADETLRISRREKALLTAAEFSWDKVAVEFCELYSELCAQVAKTTDNTFVPAFSSSQARTSERLWIQGVSRAAERLFRAGTAHFDRRYEHTRTQSSI